MVGFIFLSVSSGNNIILLSYYSVAVIKLDR